MESPSLIYIVYLLLGILFFKDEMKAYLKQKFGIKELEPDVKKLTVEGKMDRLVQHYNHDTTSLLTEIRDDLKIQGEKTGVILSKVEEIIKYGVPARNE